MYYNEKIYLENINKDEIKVIFELGCGDLFNTFKLFAYYCANIYSFECNPECIIECEENLNLMKKYVKDKIFLVKKAVSVKNGYVSFYPFDINKFNNKGASSMLKIDFSMRNINDPDYNKPNPQKEIVVESTRLDTFMNLHDITKIDLLCIDLQGYELNALKSLGDKLKNVKYILTSTAIQSTYTNGTTFKELEAFLSEFNFKYSCSAIYDYNYPDLKLTGYSEFDALFINENIHKFLIK
jgi:FkbM family methyltransferase